MYCVTIIISHPNVSICRTFYQIYGGLPWAAEDRSNAWTSSVLSQIVIIFLYTYIKFHDYNEV